MPNEPLRGVAPQTQVPRPAVPQPAQATPAATQQVAPEAQAPAQVEEPMRERTQENFEKVLESNNRLYQAQQAQVVMIQQLQQQLNQRNTPPAPVEPTAKIDPNDFQIIDPDTGQRWLDTEKMKTAMEAVNSRAQRAEETAQKLENAIRQQQRDVQEREAYSTYPELNPQGRSYNREFNKYTRAILTDSMINQQDYGGRVLSFKEAADLVRAGAVPTQGAVAQAAVAQAAEQAPQAANATPTAGQINKEQAAASVANQPLQAQAEISADELRARQIQTRLGDDNALAERLMHTEHIFGPKSGSGSRLE